MTTLGEKVRERRQSLGLTLDALAQQSGTSKSYVWEIENDRIPKPSADKLSKLADELGVTIEYLVAEGEEAQLDEAEDAAFFRKYKKMDTPVKDQIRKILDIMDKS